MNFIQQRKPEDMFKRLQARRENWYFIDTMARGYYHPYAKSVWKHHGFDSLEITEEDKEILKEGQLDFVSFSYYRSNTVKKMIHGLMLEVLQILI